MVFVCLLVLNIFRMELDSEADAMAVQFIEIGDINIIASWKFNFFNLNDRNGNKRNKVLPD